jgi:hypothetical protein
MNWQTNYSGSNNYYSDMPPMMSDGRNYTNWLPEETANNAIKQQANIKSNWDYRMYLQNNASRVMEQNTLEATYASGINQNGMTTTTSSNEPLLFRSTFDSRKHPLVESNSDLKTQYLSREQLNARMLAPQLQYNK